MKTNSMQKTLVFLAVLAAVVSACSCYNADEGYFVTYYDEADGYDASYVSEEADAGSASSKEGSEDMYSSTGQSYEEDGHDEDAYEEDAPVLRAPAVRQLKIKVPGVSGLKKLGAKLGGDADIKKCNKMCAELQDQTQKLCCPEWCRYSSDKAKESEAKGRNAQVVRQASWKAVEKASKGQGDVSSNLFIKFTKSPKCLDIVKKKKPLPALPGKTKPEKRGGLFSKKPKATPGRNPSPKRRSASPPKK